jgi:hypothetical protein
MQNRIEKATYGATYTSSKIEPKVEWVRVTPQIAEDWLKRNQNNRSIRPSHVNFLAKEMELGRFLATGEPVIFVGDELVDGQHRLMAVLRSGKLVEMLVVRHPKNANSRNIFAAIDVGITRSFRDALAVAGHVNTSTLASTLIAIDRFESAKKKAIEGIIPYSSMVHYGYEANGANRDKIFKKSIQESMLLVDVYPNAIDAAKYANAHISKTQNAKTQSKTISRTYGAYLHYVLGEIDRDQMLQFMDDLLNGGCPKDHPTHIIRERFVSIRANAYFQGSRTARVDQGYISLLAFSAWNAIRQGKKLNKKDIEAGSSIPLPV